MQQVLPDSFFNRDTKEVARDLLGKFLIRKADQKEIAAMITETEAYIGPHDRACHAFKGNTKRTRVLFGPPAIFYVYLCYGMHWMLNIVTREPGYPAAVLIRGIMIGSKPIAGPGNVTKFLQIDGTFNKKPAGRGSNLWVEDRQIAVSNIKKTPRVGVAYAGPVWSKKALRFLLDSQSRIESF